MLKIVWKAWIFFIEIQQGESQENIDLMLKKKRSLTIFAVLSIISIQILTFLLMASGLIWDTHHEWNFGKSSDYS